ncbi:hypothetical protein C8J57DRAFT_1509783 [Mycena rebaudengoi]|nr:hypothetical protein C8J57DRAFT_1509783 [Mycena rebaudengoi]
MTLVIANSLTMLCSPALIFRSWPNRHPPSRAGCWVLGHRRPLSSTALPLMQPQKLSGENVFRIARERLSAGRCSALSAAILVPHDDSNLLASSSARPGAGTSPYVIAMGHLNIKGIPHVVDVLVMLYIFSAGLFAAPKSLATFLHILRFRGVFHQDIPLRLLVPGLWDSTMFPFLSALAFALLVVFLGWKFCRRTQWRKLAEIDLFTAERAAVDEYKLSIDATATSSKRRGFFWGTR